MTELFIRGKRANIHDPLFIQGYSAKIHSQEKIIENDNNTKYVCDNSELLNTKIPEYSSIYIERYPNNSMKYIFMEELEDNLISMASNNYDWKQREGWPLLITPQMQLEYDLFDNFNDEILENIHDKDKKRKSKNDLIGKLKKHKSE